MMELKTLGQLLRELRGKRSLREVAFKAGVSYTHIAELEADKIDSPDAKKLAALAHYYKVSTLTLWRLAYPEAGLQEVPTPTLRDMRDILGRAGYSAGQIETIMGMIDMIGPKEEAISRGFRVPMNSPGWAMSG